MVPKPHSLKELGEIPIQFEAVEKKIGNKSILQSVSFKVPPGEICSMVGPNGAGKTTTIKLMLGLLKPSRGSIKVWKHNPQNIGPHTKRMGIVLDNDLLWEKNKGLENIKKYARLWGLTKNSYSERIVQLKRLLNIEEVLDDPVYTYSKGMKRKLSILIALINDPVLLICDELTAGVDPKSRHDIRQLLLNMRKAEKTVFYTSHDLEEVQKISDTVLLIDQGRLRFVVSKNDFENASLESLYLEMVGNKNAKE